MQRPNQRPPAPKISKPGKGNRQQSMIPPPNPPKHPIHVPTPNKRGS